ncbi:hypothetical protein NEIRO03_1631 [Nematocida sp. AWRm78]|nr:hypothetical protein NEIRO02_2268 [Nematocida sp. AWRm79]KAI5184175.1 hypothetical protein NEIRO03_1631 [Nematocida sp. AWRm78]
MARLNYKFVFCNFGGILNMFNTESEHIPLEMLEKYAAEELDAENNTGFLEICRIFGVSTKTSCSSDVEFAELFMSLQTIFQASNISLPYDFAALLAECKEEKESDDSAVELTHQDDLAELYIRKLQLNELLKEKSVLEDKLKGIKELQVYSEVSREALQIAKTLNISTSHQKEGKRVLCKQDCNIDFHNFFMPFVNLSIETVNFIYGQIEIPGSENGKEWAVSLLMQYHQKKLEMKAAYLRYKTPEHMLDYLITVLLMERPLATIFDICKILKRERKCVIKSVFFLCSKKILQYNRTMDAARLYNTL